MNMDYWDRIKQEITRQNTTFRWIAEKIGIPETTISSMRKSGVVSRADHAVLIAELLGVSVEYLVTGKEPSGEELRPLERQIIKNLRDLTDSDLEIIAPMIRIRAEKQAYWKNIEENGIGLYAAETSNSNYGMRKKGDVETIPPENKEILGRSHEKMNDKNEVV